MRISCQPCGDAFSISDDKVPDRPFVISCPKCRQKLRIDPRQATDSATGVALSPEGKAAATQQPAASSAQPISPENTPSFRLTDAELAGELPVLRPAEKELLARVVPVAFIVDLDHAGDIDVANLNRLGFRDVQHFPSVEAAAELFDQVLPGLLLIRAGKAAVPFPALEPIIQMPMEARRQVFVTVAANNVRSLDGSVAFLMQVDALVQSNDLPHLAPLLRRALLHHVQLYRHWHDEG
ncbi:MAG: zinc-ribbon domain-containing protein [Acidobacteriota bacterium]